MAHTCLVIGATGAMGSAVVRALLTDSEHSWTIRALTRAPEGERGQALLRAAEGRVRLIGGNLDDETALRAAMEGIDALFINTDFFSSMSVRREYEQGLRVLEVAQAQQVARVIYSSLDAAVSLTAGAVPVPHYDAKAGVEHWIDLMRSDEFMRKEAEGWYSRHVAVLVTAPYFENFQSFFPPAEEQFSDGRQGRVFHFAGGGQPHPMIALDDIGWFARMMFNRFVKWGGRSLRVLGDAPTLESVARSFERVTGIPCESRDLPLSVVREFPGFGHDLANMYRFFQEHGVQRDLAALRRLHPGLMDFEAWLRKTGWRGERLEVQGAKLL